MDSPFSSESPTVSSTRMTSEEMMERASSWTLKCDNALLNRLNDFSENLVGQAEEISHDCDTLGEDVSLLHSQVHNVTNQFLMLSNTQFVENRVEEFVETMNSHESSQISPEKTKAEKEAELISKMKEAIQIGVNANIEMEKKRLDACTLNTTPPKLNLPYIIGSSKFFSSRSCGLADDTKSFVQATQEGAINSVHEFQDSISTSSSSLGNNHETVVTNPTGTQPHSAFVRELYRPPSLNHSLDREGSVSSDDLFSSNIRPPSNTSSNCNLAQTPKDSQNSASHSSSVPPVLANKHKSLVDDLNGVIRSLAPPPPPVDSDESDYDFKPPCPGQDLSRKVFADIDDEDDDLFGSNSIFSSKKTQEVDDDDSFFDKPAPQKPTSLFSQYNSQPPPPVLYQSTPPPPIPTQRHGSNLRAEKVNRTLFPDSPETDEEDIFAFSANKSPHEPAAKDESKLFGPTVMPSVYSDSDVASSLPSPRAEPSQKPKLPYGAVSMFGNMPPPVIPKLNSTSTSGVTENDGVSKSEKVPEEVKSTLVHEENNVAPAPAVQTDIKSVSRNGAKQNDGRKSIKHRSVFDDDSSDDDLFSTKNNINSSRNSAKSNPKSSTPLFDDASEHGASFPNSDSNPIRSDSILSSSEIKAHPKIADRTTTSEDTQDRTEQDKPKLRYGAVSMFGNLPPPAIPIRKQIPDLLGNNVEEASDKVLSPITTTSPPPSVPVSIPTLKTTEPVFPPEVSLQASEAAVQKTVSETSSPVSNVVGDAQTTNPTPKSTTAIHPVRVDMLAPKPMEKTQQQNGIHDGKLESRPVPSHELEHPPILGSSSSSESIGSRSSRFSKSRSIFDDDSDDDLFAVKRNTEPKKKVTTTTSSAKRATSLFDDISSETAKTNRISPLFSDDDDFPSFSSKPQNSTLSITSSNVHEAQKPSNHSILDVVDEACGVPSDSVIPPSSADSAANSKSLISNSAGIPEETPQKRWLPAGSVSMFGGLPPPVIPIRNPTSASVRHIDSSDITPKVQTPISVTDAVVKPPESKIQQETPGHSKVDFVNPKVFQNQDAQIPVPAKIKRDMKNSIFDEDSDEDLFSGSKQPTNKKFLPTHSKTLFEDIESGAKAESTSSLHLQTDDVAKKTAKEHVQPATSNTTMETKSKPNKPVSIFDDSDSDSDIFSSKKKAIINNPSGGKLFQSKAKQKSNTKSIFGNDSDEEIFTTKKVPKAKDNPSEFAGSNLPVKSAEEPAKETVSANNHISVTENNYVDTRDPTVPSAISENDNPEVNDLVVTSDIKITASVEDHFLDLPTEPPNLLTSIAKSRPKVGPHRRRPTRKPKSAESTYNDLSYSISPNNDGIIRSDPLASVQPNECEPDPFIDSGSE